MAEAALFGLASKLLTTIVSMETVKRRKAAPGRKEYSKLMKSIQAIQDLLLDAERQQESSAAVKEWISHVGDVLYDAEDMLDEISTKQLTEEHKMIRNQVRDLFSPTENLFLYVTRAHLRLRALSKSLDRISKDSEMFCLKPRKTEAAAAAADEFEDSCVGVVVGREEDKQTILRFLLEDSNNVEKNVIAIVGIGGMGKTSLARVVYSDEQVTQKFQSRWWASISDVDDDLEILRRIGKAIGVEKSRVLRGDMLETGIRASVGKGGKYLLVIDGVRDDNRTKWSNRMKLLLNGFEGCRIIVTTRSSSAAKAMEATKTHMLCGLSDGEACQLFEAVAFSEEIKGDAGREKLAKRIATNCSGVPLAIRRIAMILRGKTREEDWKAFMDVELSKVALSENIVLSVLKLSYDRLPSDLKQCFAYCSLFPKNRAISRRKILRLWIAQGYINNNNPSPGQTTLEEVGNAYFDRLLSLQFLQKAAEDEDEDEERYKMYDLVHDLAQHVAGDQTAILTHHTSHDDQGARHVSVCYDASSEILQRQLISVDRLRSCLFMTATHRRRQSPLDPQHLTKFRFLRALDLSEVGIEDAACIVAFKLLRYLNLSRNLFTSLPNSISELCNLLTLDISWCKNLKAWPPNMTRLTKLRHLDYSHCPCLTHMPEGFEELHGIDCGSCGSSPPRIEEDDDGVSPTPADPQPRTRERKETKSSSRRKRLSNMMKSHSREQ